MVCVWLLLTATDWDASRIDLMNGYFHKNLIFRSLQLSEYRFTVQSKFYLVFDAVFLAAFRSSLQMNKLKMVQKPKPIYN